MHIIRETVTFTCETDPRENCKSCYMTIISLMTLSPQRVKVVFCVHDSNTHSKIDCFQFLCSPVAFFFFQTEFMCEIFGTVISSTFNKLKLIFLTKTSHLDSL